MWDWMASSPLMDVNEDRLEIWDNTDTSNNCTTVDHFVWTYNYGTMLMGAATMYNYVSLALFEEATRTWFVLGDEVPN